MTAYQLDSKQRKRLRADHRHLVVLQLRHEKATPQGKLNLEVLIKSTERRILLAETNPEFY